MSKQVLFVTYGGGHAPMAYPVVHALRRSEAFARQELQVQVLGLPAAAHTLRSNGVECLGFRDFLDPLEDADAIEWGRELATRHHSPTIGVAYEDSVAYLGLCYKDLVLRHGEAEAAALMAQKGRQAFFPLTVMERVFDRLRPDFVVTSNSPRSEAAAIELATRRGIDSLSMTDLMSSMGGLFLKAGTVTFLSSVARDMYKADGLVDESASQLVCTGNPAFDKILCLQWEKDPAWMAENFPHVGDRKVVLHADMPAYWDCDGQFTHFRTEDEIWAELDACYQAVRASGAAYLVRPHPSQVVAFYERWISGKPGAYLAAACNLHRVLANADLVIARTTTVSLEAVLMRRRVLQLEWERHRDLPLAAMGVAWGSRGFETLAGDVKNALENDAGFKEIQRQIDDKLPAEPAAPKIAAIILGRLRLSQQMRAAT